MDGRLTPDKRKEIDIEIRDLNRRSEDDKAHPKISLCSGRPQPYVEAFAQLLEVKIPSICENGGVIYDPVEDKSIINPAVGKEAIKELRNLREFMEEHILSLFPGAKIELGKEVSMSLNPPRNVDINTFYEKVKKEVESRTRNLYVTRSRSAVDILPMGISKLSALIEIARQLGLDLNQICSIGDSIGDIEVLKSVGFPAAPANSEDEVKKIALYISPYEDGRGVVDIIFRCVELNRRIEKSEESWAVAPNSPSRMERYC